MEELPEDLSQYLAPRVERLGYLGEFFKCGAAKPQALLAFQQFTEESKRGQSKRLVEVVALTAAMALGNNYERNQHERLSIRLGFGRDWVTAVEACDPQSSTLLGDDEKAVQAYVLAAIKGHGHGVSAQLDALIDVVGAYDAVGIMMVLGRYMTHALMVNSLELAPPVPSIFEDGFTG
ncbi:hypothetical protein HBA55_02085 [Pseudomaricurvus alkylphenolicus]|nr:hypothetical protein [Pseudomaricurvus alkylphenolicus]